MFILTILFSEPPRLEGLMTKQGHQIQHSSTANRHYCEKDHRINHMFHRTFANKRITVGFVNGASNIIKALNIKVFKSLLTRSLSQPMPCNLQLFFFLSLINRGLHLQEASRFGIASKAE